MSHQKIPAAPYRIAEETFVIPQVFPMGPLGYSCVNSLVIRGKEPIIVDTGPAVRREQWLEQVWSLVDPKDVRWVFLSHDDTDHTGNLLQVLEAAPNAKLVTTWFTIERLAADYEIAPDRYIWVNDGERFDAGDRTLAAVRPPLFDGPTTRGLFDPTTGAYWAADCFAAVPVPAPVEDAADVPAEAYRDAFLVSHRLVSPWHRWLDQAKFDGHVARVQSLPITTVGTAHGPALHGATLKTAFAMLRELPQMEPFPEFTQRDLEALVASMQGAAAAA